jgi:hypothetical protein
MPEEEAVERAREDEREGKSPSTQTKVARLEHSGDISFIKAE